MDQHIPMDFPHNPVGSNTDDETLSRGDITLDTRRYRVWKNGQEVQLGTREFRLLALLMREPGRVFTRHEILDHVWNEDTEISDRNADASIKRLRQAFGQKQDGQPIRTVRLVGYAFNEYYGAGNTPENR